MSAATQTRPMATGGMLFAGTIMVVTGIFQIFEGIVGIAKDPIFVNTTNYVFKFNTTSWGWIHLIIGIIVAVVGFFVFTAAPWARFAGMFIVAIQMFSTFMFLPYFPFWALIVIAIDVFILWALATGPRDYADDDRYPIDPRVSGR